MPTSKVGKRIPFLVNALFLLASFVLLLGEPRSLTAATINRQSDGTVFIEFAGVSLAAVPAPKGADYKMPIMPAEEGLQKLIAAFEQLQKTGTYARKALNRLKKSGDVIIVYDPSFPGSEGSALTLGAFLPEYYDPSQGKKRLFTIISRFGIKWTHEELVAILAHELLGHGIQHLDGFLEQVRRIDLECGAVLYEEAVYQGLKLDKRSSRIIKFRKALERHWCRPFKAYQAKQARDSLVYWNDLNPDVPALLKALNGYFSYQIKSGAGAKAVALDRDITLKRSIEEIRRREGDKSADRLFDAAIRFRDGVQIRKDLKKARILFLAAAEDGHPTAAAEAAKLPK